MSRVVVLSGGIGTGKSTVSRLWAALGAVVIDADAIVHELQAPGAPLLGAIRAAFGAGVFRPNGALHREALAERVFRDARERARLNALVHPRVREEMSRRLEASLREGAPLVVLDIPLFFESRRAEGAPAFPLDASVLVYAPRELQIARTARRDGVAAEAVERRLAAQLPIEEKRARADFVIDNSGALEATQRQLLSLHRALLEDARGPKARARLEAQANGVIKST